MDVATAEVPTLMPTVVFREIHKNAYLKRHSSERRTAFPPRKSEKVWAVFCVHDDTDAFLELYTDQKVALTHKPDWFSSLKTTLHISPSICGHDEEFEFAITLPSQVIRLAAPTWDAMMEWVETIRNKLRELRILAPRENVYSKMPEPRQPLLPTRDPTSPLPLPPAGPSTLVPGVETRPGRREQSQPSSRSTESNEHNLSNREQRSALVVNRESDVSVRLEVRSGSSETSIITVNEESHTNRVSRFNDQLRSPIDDQSSVVVVTEPQVSSIAVGDVSRIRLVRAESVPAEASSVESNVTVIEVPAPRSVSISTSSEGLDRSAQPENDSEVFLTPPTTPHYEHLYVPDHPEVLRPEVRCKLERVNSAGMIPRVPPKHGDHQTPPKLPSRSDLLPRSSSCRGPGDSKVSIGTSQPNINGTSDVVNVSANKPAAPNKTSVVAVKSTSTATASSSNVTVGGSQKPQITQNSTKHSALVPTPAALEVKDIPLIGGHQRRRRRSLSTDAGGGSSASALTPLRGCADLIRVNVPGNGGVGLPVPAGPVVANDQIPRWTLREQQVAQLKREMAHKAGVRLPLRRNDCIMSIALVDIYDAVWVAGWKQKEHPILYSALHLGDQLLSVGGVRPKNSTDAQKLLRSACGPHIEIIVNRLPLGNVLALQRSSDGTVGIQLDSGPEIKEVIPDGPAAQQGLKSKTPTADGHSLSTWTLTEINGRPLNLFCKEQEVLTRLSSVGKEISILVQPTEFVKCLRKQLKNIKGYKDYLLP